LIDLFRRFCIAFGFHRKSSNLDNNAMDPSPHCSVYSPPNLLSGWVIASVILATAFAVAVAMLVAAPQTRKP
jgi:hypothetical protein